MNKIIAIDEVNDVSNTFHDQHKKIVLVGGVFDILHVGHITFLTEAKKQADILIVLLESDESAKQQKGSDRPINIQDDRAILLAALAVVDAVVLLPGPMGNNEYDRLVGIIKPAIIATTKGDTLRVHKERQAALVGATVVDVIEAIDNKSTTRLATTIREKFSL